MAMTLQDIGFDLANFKLGLAERNVKLPAATWNQLVAEVKVDDIVARARERVQYRKWEGTPLGQLRTEAEVREHFGMGPDNVAYEVLVDGRRAYFQYCDPDGSLLTEADWEESAKKLCERVVRQLARDEISRILTDKAIDASV